MPLASPTTPARNRRARLTSPPHLAWVFALQGANQNLSAFSIARLNATRIPRDSSKKSRARLASPPHLAWVFALQGANQNLSAFFSRKTEASYLAMNSAPDLSDLFPDFSPVPQLVFVNDGVSLQSEADQRVILVHGVVYSHYSREDRTAEAYALVSLYESGYVD